MISNSVAAPIIDQYLFGTSKGSELTADQKTTISAIAGLAGTAVGASVGGTGLDAIAGGNAAQNGVENNQVVSGGYTGSEMDQLEQVVAERAKAEVVTQKITLPKDDASYQKPKPKPTLKPKLKPKPSPKAEDSPSNKVKQKVLNSNGYGINIANMSGAMEGSALEQREAYYANSYDPNNVVRGNSKTYNIYYGQQIEETLPYEIGVATVDPKTGQGYVTVAKDNDGYPLLRPINETDRALMAADIPFNTAVGVTNGVVGAGAVIAAKGGKILSNTGKAACFAAGTLVRTVEGYKAIETLVEGDLVLSQNDRDFSLVHQMVLTTTATEHQSIFELQLQNVAGDLELISTTAEHPFWVKDHGWLMAQYLTGDMILLDEHGQDVRIHSAHASDRVETVYNISVDESHTYFVGGFGVWVHNACDFKLAGDSYLKSNGIDAHQIKKELVGNRGSQYDIYRDTRTGELFLLGKGGKGSPIATGEVIK